MTERLDELSTDPWDQYFDRKGRQITLREHMELFKDSSYRFIRKDKVDNITISTVWLGRADEDMLLDPKPQPPRVFGTMIWMLDLKDACNIIAEIRSSTEEQALARHEKLLEALKLGQRDALDSVLAEIGPDRVQ
jgi:hypothetical protein